LINRKFWSQKGEQNMTKNRHLIWFNVLIWQKRWRLLCCFRFIGKNNATFVCEFRKDIERRSSMSAVVYLVVGLMGLLFALISIAGWKQKEDD